MTGVLDTKLKPARIDIDELMSISGQVKQQIRSRTVSSGDHDMDKLLWEKKKTVEEAVATAGLFGELSIPAPSRRKTETHRQLLF